MKLLKRALLIHWHYYQNELIEFETINFLTGKNASGKSTLIDALQLLLLGDTSGYFFNKAANERSQRTLKGYLKGEIGDDGDIGFRYLRDGRFTSYICAEFYDHIKNAPFTLGVVFDFYEDDSYEHKFFILEDKIPDNRFISHKIPMSIKELRNYLAKNYRKTKYSIYDTNRSYQDALKSKFGSINNKYFSLFKKAVSFTPITDIETFITEYVCDVKSNIDIIPMQDNIRYYKRLEHDAEMIEKRVAALEQICSVYKSYLEDEEKFKLYDYLIERAKSEQISVKVNECISNIAKGKKEIDELRTRQESLISQIQSLKIQEEELINAKISSDIGKRFSQLQKEKLEVENKIEEYKNIIKKTIENLKNYANIWHSELKKLQIKLPENVCEFLNEYELNAIYDDILEKSIFVIDACNELYQKNTEEIVCLDETYFESLREAMDKIKVLSINFKNTLFNYIQNLERNLKDIDNTLENLKKGIKPYNPKLLELKKSIQDEILKKYNKQVDIHILADLLEIRDERWKNAIEAYLHTQKFYLIIEPKYFIEGLIIYDRLKFQKGFYDFGLVNTGKISLIKPQYVQNSLAEEITTDNVFARYFVNLILGNVIKCDNVEDLPKHDKAITDSCMLYQNYVARQLNPERWKYPYIGRKSIEVQIVKKEEEKEHVKKTLNSLKYLYDWITAITQLEVISKNEINTAIENFSKYDLMDKLKQKKNQIEQEISQLDLSWLEKIENKINEVKRTIKQKESEERRINEKIVEMNTIINNIEQRELPSLKFEYERYLKEISEKFTQEFIENKGEPRFQKELQDKKLPNQIERDYLSSYGKAKNQKENRWIEIVNLRSDYNRDYLMAYDVQSADNSKYENELKELKDIKLPEYKEKINDARTKAFEQFRDDFLAKLKYNIEMVFSQIDELNGALKESSFGDDRYRFIVKPKPEYKKYYDMITDPLLLEGGFNLTSEQFKKKHSEAIDDLFRMLVFDDGEYNTDKRAEIEKNIKRFTDYRTYLSFDLEVIDSEDRKQRLSKTLHKKSGGETQTPFYVAVLASFAQLYRVKDKNITSSNTSRLIIFDEAFNKMDSERIRESIKLLKRFKLQAIISAPPEKMADIATLADRTLCVIREGNLSRVCLFDPRKIDEVDF